MRILLLGSSSSPYIGELAAVLSGHGLRPDILDVADNRFVRGERTRRLVPAFAGRVPRIGGRVRAFGARRFLQPDRYDICSIHYNSRVYSGPLFGAVTSAAPRLVISVWGSDFDGCDARTLARQRRLYTSAAAITFNNDDLRRRFAAHYQLPADKLVIARFGIGLLEEIEHARRELADPGRAKAALGFPDGAVTITCGYNGRPAQNHERIVDALRRARPLAPRRVFVVVPMTYGARPGYADRVSRALRSAGLEHRIIDRRLTQREMALVRIASDLMIHMQDHDSFSAAMQEHLYAGSVVINAGWLKYGMLTERGVYYRTAADFEALVDMLPELVGRIEDHRARCVGNAGIISELSSWASNAPRWVQLYRDLAAAR